MCFSDLLKQLSLISILIGLTACAGTTDESAFSDDNITLTPNTESSDKLSPSTPENLRKSIDSLNGNAIKIEWDASTDDTAVIGYIILRDGDPLNTTSNTNFIDNNVSPETTYIYAVIAYDAANNIASSSNLSITNTLTKASATLSWMPPSLNVDNTSLTNLNGYKIYYGLSEDDLSNSIDIKIGVATHVIEDLTAGITYYFTITAINSDKIESAKSKIVSIKIAG